MVCPECNGSGTVVKWNLNDDSGDGIQICTWCAGHGLIALTGGSDEKRLPEVREEA